MQHFVPYLVGEVELQSRWVVPQNTVQVHLIWCVVEGAHQRAQWPFVADFILESRVVEPLDLEAEFLRDRKHIVNPHREVLLADSFGCTLDIREAVLITFLVRTNKQVGELATRRSGLCEQLRNGELQQRLGKQEARFERHTNDGGGRRSVDSIVIKRFIEKPLRLFLEDLGNDLEQTLRWNALPVLDHRQIRNRRTGIGIDLYASH